MAGAADIGHRPVDRQAGPAQFPTKKEAQDWVTEQRRLWASASWSAKSERTFDEVADHWLTLREADSSVGPNTVRADRESLSYARRAFGGVPVQKLTPAALADWAAGLTGKGVRALAPATKRRAIICLKSVMGHALKMRWVYYDASAVLVSPEQKTVNASDASDIWTPEQMNTFLDHVADHRFSGCFALTLLGLRREEVGGLRWCDIDLETGALRIRQARVDINGHDTIVATKTECSARDLPLPPREPAMLKAMRTVHVGERLAVGRPMAVTDLLLCRADSLPMAVRQYSREFAAQRKASGLPAITLAKLRHSNVSRLRDAGVAADVVAAWHGYTERMTQAVYGRVTDARIVAAAEVFSKATGNKVENWIVILTLGQALDAIADGETDWDTLTRRLPRNALPAVLAQVYTEMDYIALTAAITEAWTLCEYPEQAVDREQWIEWFEWVGYTEDGVYAYQPNQVVLYRGGGDWDRMAWSADRGIAEWFRDRFRHTHGDGRLWRATVPGRALLAHIHLGGRGEDEYVTNPAGIVVEELKTR